MYAGRCIGEPHEVPSPCPDVAVLSDRPLVLGCSSCGVAEPVPVDDTLQLRDSARAFFVAHSDCETSIGLDGYTLRGWALPALQPPPWRPSAERGSV